ncbi:MAG TPA: hypothetical protein VFI06_02325 [Chitinophagaceae bacterium]|nr:hypothetical protein [Chitinophagaceae bacterium]
MSYYPTRVELHEAKWPEDYDKLHTEMAKEGFGRTVSGDNGKIYRLPTAEYLKTGQLVLNDVLQAAKRAAAKVKPKFAVIVWEASKATWDGLDETK